MFAGFFVLAAALFVVGLLVIVLTARFERQGGADPDARGYYAFAVTAMLFGAWLMLVFSFSS